MYVQRSIAKAKRKQQHFVISVTIGCLAWLLHQKTFSLRESNSILSGKGKGFTFEELFRSPLSEIAFEFDQKKELMLKV